MSTIIPTESEIPKCRCACCCKHLRCTRPSSAKASSLWNVRNDSSNVSSLLAPDHLEAPSELSIVSKPRFSRSIKSATIRAAKNNDIETHCEGCYCREAPNMPLLNLKPRPECAREEDVGSLVRRSMRRCSGLKGSCGVKRVPREPEDTIRDSTGEFSRCDLTYTKARNAYESRLGDLRKIDEDEEFTDTNETKGSTTVPSSEYREDERMTYKDFKDLVRFCRDNYFDCHSTADVVSKAPDEHKCVHKFVINDRFLPQPLKSDSFGVSCCEVCNKPMEMYRSQKPPPIAKKKSVNKVKEIYQCNLAPPRINIGSGKETVQIKVPGRLSKQCLYERAPNFKIRRNVPGNSYALRYQKGCF